MSEIVSAEVYKLLEDIREACMDIMKYTVQGREKFDSDEPTRLAIIWHINKIGIAMSTMYNKGKGSGAELQSRHPEISWKVWVDQRNILAHNYSDVNFNLVWNSALEASDLLRNIEAILATVQKD